MSTLRELVAKWREYGERSIMQEAYTALGEARGYRNCATELEAVAEEGSNNNAKEELDAIDELCGPRQPDDATSVFCRISHKLRAAAPSLHKEPSAVQVAGRMEQTFAEHTRRLGILIAEEQEKPLPNNALIAALCDSIRLAREATAIISEPAAQHKEGAGGDAQGPITGVAAGIRARARAEALEEAAKLVEERLIYTGPGNPDPEAIQQSLATAIRQRASPAGRAEQEPKT